MMMRLLAVLAVLVACTAAIQTPRARPPVYTGSPAEFASWMATHNKAYPTPSAETTAYETYKANIVSINALNDEHYPRVAFSANEFADLTPAEFRKGYLMPKGTVPAVGAAGAGGGEWPVAEKLPTDVPESWDWRTQNVVSPVKNQGGCGSCWAFSTTGNVESQMMLKKGMKNVQLSEQNLVDCDHECMQYEGENVCDQGCNGGLMPNAFNYILKTGGIDTEASYPYEGVDDTCRFNKSNSGASITNFTLISHDETQMAAYCYANGPISIAADASMWQFYLFGVWYLPCGTSLDHGILIVGW